MESSSQLQHPRAHTIDHGGGGEDEHHHEHGPKAVIKKVKQKAKKIKETLTKHGHGHEHHDEDDDNDEDEQDPEAHGAIRGGPQSGGVNLEKPEAMAHAPPPYAAAHVAGFTHDGDGKKSTMNELKDGPLPSNYGSKVSAAGREEAGMGSLVHSMDKMRVHDEDPKQKSAPGGSHAETTPEPSCVSKMSSAAADAKNAMTSKLGSAGGEDKSSNTSSVGGYGNKIASSVAGTLAPVYGKVAGVGSTVMSKVSGGGDGAGSTAAEDKGGVSVKEYLVEKLRPGEEDEMLSKVITNSMYKDKGKEEGKKEKPMGKVTESPEVRKRLGMDKKKKNGGGDGVSADSGAAGQAVVDRVKAWFGMASPPNSQPSSGTLLAGKKEEGSH